MGKGALPGSIRDYYKKRGQRTHGMTGRRQKLSPASAEKRRLWKVERKAARRAAAKQTKLNL